MPGATKGNFPLKDSYSALTDQLANKMVQQKKSKKPKLPPPPGMPMTPPRLVQKGIRALRGLI